MIYFFKSEIDWGSYEQLKAQLWTAPELLRQQVWNRKLFKKKSFTAGSGSENIWTIWKKLEETTQQLIKERNNQVRQLEESKHLPLLLLK